MIDPVEEARAEADRIMREEPTKAEVAAKHGVDWRALLDNPITQVRCERCRGGGVELEKNGLADAIDKLNAAMAKPGEKPKLCDRRCVRCSGLGSHGTPCPECSGPRPSHTFFCSSKMWPGEGDPAPEEDRAEIEASQRDRSKLEGRPCPPEIHARGAWAYLERKAQEKARGPR